MHPSSAPRITLMVLGSALGCGPSVSVSGDGGSDAGTGSSGDSASMSGPDDVSTMGEVPTGAGTDSSSSPSPTDTGAQTTGATSTDPSTGAATTGRSLECDDGEYRGALVIGGLDRVRVFRRDDVAGTCTWLTFVGEGGGPSAYDVEATAPWALESAAYNMDPASCDGDVPGNAGEIRIPDAWGSATFDQASPQQPCSADLDITLQLLENPDPAIIVPFCASMLALSDC